ncbi:MAG: class F sortase [Actinomycetales bacterium]|nr:class F sortase [Actinomycetales bacterium]
MTVHQHSARPAGPTMRRLATLGVASAVAAVLSVSGCSYPTVTAVPVAAGGSIRTAAGGSIHTATAPPPSTTPAPAPTPRTASSTPSTAPAPASTRLVPVRIRVPAIGVDASLVRLGLTPDGALAVPTRAMTAGWYTGSPVPGRVGPAVIAGHVHWSGIPAVFAHLADLAPGDRILVSRSDGSTAAFTVDRVATYAKTRFPTALVYGSLDVPGLRLITCGGFDPVAHAYEANVIVFATLATA